MKAAAEALGVEFPTGATFVDHEGNEMEVDQDGDSGEESEESEEEDDDEMDGVEKPVPSVETQDKPEAATSQTNDKPATSNAMEFPWTTGLTATGERIIAYRRVGRWGNSFLVEIGTKENPLYVFKTGQEAGLFKTKKYLDSKGIKQLGGEGKRVWSYKDRGSFQKLL